MLTLDVTDQQLIDLMLVDGRQTNRALAEALGLSESTVANRIRRLVENGVMNVIPQFDWHAAGFHALAIAYLETSGRPPAEVAGQIAALPGSLSVHLTVGDADVIALVLAVDDTELHQVLATIRRTDGVCGLRASRVVEVFSYSRSLALLPFQSTSVETFPNPALRLTDLDRFIIEQLRADGRMSSREIARGTSVADVTVRRRQRQMEDAGLLRVAAVCHPFASGRIAASAHIAIDADGDPAAVAKHLSTDPAVAACMTTIGSHPITAIVAAPTSEELGRYITGTLREVPGVRSAKAWAMTAVAAHRSDLSRFL